MLKVLSSWQSKKNGEDFAKFADLYRENKLLGMNYFILEDLRLQWALAFDERDAVKIGQVFNRLRESLANIKDYEHQFFNPYFATRYVDSILSTEEIESTLYDRAGHILNQGCITDDPGLLSSMKRFEVMISSLQRNRLEQLANGIIDTKNYDTEYQEKGKRYLEDVKRVLNQKIKSLENI